MAVTPFLELPENRLAVVASAQLLQSYAQRSPFPLWYLHGGPGCGKTHLVEQLVAKFTLTEGVSAQIVSAIDVGRTMQQLPTERQEIVRDWLANDLLVIEDLQHFQTPTGDEFAALLDQRLRRQKPCVVTATEGPARLSLSPRLASRVSGGLVSAIAPLAEASRKELARAFCEQQKLKVADDLLAWLARHPGGARPILGDVRRLVTLAKIHKPPLTYEALAEDLAEQDAPPAPSPLERIADLVCTRYRINERALKGKSRVKHLVSARQTAMYIARQLGHSFPEIGRWFGGRDHTTAMHACEKIAIAISTNQEMAQEIRDLQAKLV